MIRGTWKNKKWRRLMKFVCRICHKDRKTMSHERKGAEICLRCETNKVPDNQPSLFEAEKLIRINHLDLFSGIGGFAIAVDEVFPGSEHIFCDNNSYCLAVLQKHWPDSIMFNDIKSLNKETLCQKFAQNAEQKQEHSLHLKAGAMNAKASITKNTTLKIEKKELHIQKTEGGNNENKSSSITEENAFVAEKQNQDFLPLITSTEEEQKKEDCEEQGIRHFSTLSGKDSLKNINSCATTAIWPKHSTEYVRTKKKNNQSKIYGDIRALHADGFDTNPDINGCASRQEEVNATETNEQAFNNSKKHYGKIDIITGGFPCQPFSQAGKRQGTNDDRYLWPEMLRVIREFKPTWVIAENVRGLLTLQQGVVFEQVCLDLEASGYEVQPLIIPAVAVNAPHRRDRIWFIANRKDERGGGGGSKKCGVSERKLVEEKQKGDTPRSENKGRISWDENWINLATELCSVDDGLSVELGGIKLTKAGNRNAQLKAYGNAIVPQVAIEILKAIKQTGI